ncbi:hypothetical protein H7198_01940 [Fructobacillus sp. CRL 2054]|uniref:hypothetical protein n=1 Tax=Fructobacillus sp. CRL 2054 TaxID=2763007 RepID=UPI002378A95F|nr:hypothetical protein [Fructobacillus sp. CRL 2054]MDD9138374.1 hypothetical protein [Fructobacillus sp. CRL 2054]
MKIELIESLDKRAEPSVAWQIEQVRRGQADCLFLLNPHEDAKSICESLGLKDSQVFDMASRESLESVPGGSGRFLFDIKVPNQGQINLDEEGAVNFSSAGQRIANVVLFSNSHYLVQAIAWLDQDGHVSRKDVYRRNGQLFAQQYFNRGELLESDFYFGHDIAVLSDFYFLGRRNFSRVFGISYPSYEAAQQDYFAKIEGESEVEITKIGSLGTIAKKAVLALPQGLFDENEAVDAEVQMILENPSYPIDEVRVSAEDYQKAERLGLPLYKLKVVNF